MNSECLCAWTTRPIYPRFGTGQRCVVFLFHAILPPLPSKPPRHVLRSTFLSTLMMIGLKRQTHACRTPPPRAPLPLSHTHTQTHTDTHRHTHRHTHTGTHTQTTTNLTTMTTNTQAPRIGDQGGISDSLITDTFLGCETCALRSHFFFYIYTTTSSAILTPPARSSTLACTHYRYLEDNRHSADPFFVSFCQPPLHVPLLCPRRAFPLSRKHQTGCVWPLFDARTLQSRPTGYHSRLHTKLAPKGHYTSTTNVPLYVGDEDLRGIDWTTWVWPTLKVREHVTAL